LQIYSLPLMESIDLVIRMPTSFKVTRVGIFRSGFRVSAFTLHLKKTSSLRCCNPSSSCPILCTSDSAQSVNLVTACSELAEADVKCFTASLVTHLHRHKSSICNMLINLHLDNFAIGKSVKAFRNPESIRILGITVSTEVKIILGSQPGYCEME
jgi:hypothetical protein